MAQNRSGAKGAAGLSDHRAALDEALAKLPPIVVVTGECEYLRSEAAARFRDAWLAANPGGDTALLRGAGDSRPAGLADVVRELAGGSLFAREKLVLARQAERILFPQSARAAAEDVAGEAAEAAAGGEREKRFLDFLERPAEKIWLLLETETLPRNRTLGKRLAATAHLVPCPPPAGRDLPGWLAMKAGEFGKAIDEEACDLLAQAHGADLGVLAREVEKLALFAGDGRGIDADMAREFMTGLIEFDVFAMTNAVEERNPRKALHYARRIAMQGVRDQRGKREDGERSAHRTLSMLAGTFQSLLRAKVAQAERGGADEFAASEGLSPWRAKRLLEAAGRFELRELRLLARSAAEQIAKVHDTGGDPLLALELMAATFARGGRRGR